MDWLGFAVFALVLGLVFCPKDVGKNIAKVQIAYEKELQDAKNNTTN
jgi:hypothetical protein